METIFRIVFESILEVVCYRIGVFVVGRSGRFRAEPIATREKFKLDAKGKKRDAEGRLVLSDGTVTLIGVATLVIAGAAFCLAYALMRFSADRFLS